MLTLDQLNQIDLHLRKENWLLNEDLIAELTDHYAAGIDERMAHGLSFTDALCAVHTDFGGRKGLLKMEEEAQKQQGRKYHRQEWQLIRSFTQGSRWYVSVCLFAAVISLNAYSGYYETFVFTNLMGFFFVLNVVIGNVIAYAFRYVHIRRRISPVSDYGTAPIFSLLYLFCFLTLGIELYEKSFWGFPLSNAKTVVLITTLETLCLIYYIVVFISLRQSVNNKRELPA